MILKSKDHPTANGRQPIAGDQMWILEVPLEDGEKLTLHLGKKGRDLIFDMMLADYAQSGEKEPT